MKFPSQRLLFFISIIIPRAIVLGAMFKSRSVLLPLEMRKCATSLAVMMIRFCPKELNKFYSAQTISIDLLSLPLGHQSSFSVDIDTLKRALANKDLRDSLQSIYSGTIAFEKSNSSLNVINQGPNKFSNGYQLKFWTENEKNILLKNSGYYSDDALNSLRFKIQEIARLVLKLICVSIIEFTITVLLIFINDIELLHICNYFQ